jgi:hypothetical protein
MPAHGKRSGTEVALFAAKSSYLLPSEDFVAARRICSSRTGFVVEPVTVEAFSTTIFRRGNLANRKTRDWGDPISCRAEEPLWCAVAGVDR